MPGPIRSVKLCAALKSSSAGTGTTGTIRPLPSLVPSSPSNCASSSAFLAVLAWKRR